MKILSFAFALLLFLFACNSSVDSLDKQNQTGTIHKLEISTWMYGTHTLDDSDGKHLYALTSSTIDLNEYVGKDVTVSGKLVEGYPVDSGPLFLDVTSVTVNK